ncbi:MAG: right-handed parallel beta-helix repeat-containing protein [Candidatus Helarchaeales archaeon]
MKNSRQVIFSIMLIIILIVPVFYFSSSNINLSRDDDAGVLVSDTLEKSYTMHPRIDISGVSELIAFPNKTGSGSEGDPYVIEGLEIDANEEGSAISLYNIFGVYLIIQNCYVHDSRKINVWHDSGIEMYNCSNVKIINCTIENNYYGVYSSKGQNISITNNSFSNNEKSGVYLQDSSNITIFNNDIAGSPDYGIHLKSSNDNNMSSNNITDNEDYGIFFESSHNNTIELNKITSNNDWGIRIEESNYNNVRDNVFNHNQVGIYCVNANNNSLTNDVFYNNSGNAISIDNCTDTQVKSCTVNSNNSQVAGMRVYQSGNTTIESCKINGCAMAIEINRATGCNLTANMLEGCGLWFQGDNLNHFNMHTIDNSNTVNGKTLYYYANQTNLLPTDFQDGGQIILANCNQSWISDVETHNATVGIGLFYSHDNNVSNAQSSANKNGIHLEQSGNTTISAFTSTNNTGNGIYCSYSDNTTITNCSVNYSYYGVYCYKSDYLTIEGTNASYCNDSNPATNSDAGFLIAYCDNVHLSNDQATSNAIYGFLITDGTNLTITGSEATNNPKGIKIDQFSDSSLDLCNTFDNPESGIYISRSTNVTINNCRQYNDGIMLYGYSMLHFSSHHIDQSNLMNGKPVYYIVNSTGIIQAQDAGQLILVNCNDTQLDSMNLNNCSNPVFIVYSNNMYISNCKFQNVSTGIYSYVSNNITLDKISIQNSKSNGIELKSCNEFTINNNYIRNSSQYGIFFDHSSNASVLNCNISECIQGIYFYFADNVSIIKNHLSNNTDGIRSLRSTSCLVLQNYIQNNLRYGIHLYTSADSNTVVNNIIINNDGVGIGLDVQSKSNFIIYNIVFNNSDLSINNQIQDNGTENLISPNSLSPYADSDADGLDDDEEIALGTNPFQIDSDNDNLNDFFELNIGTDPLSNDTDGDGFTDWIEVSQGTNPLNATDFPIDNETNDNNTINNINNVTTYNYETATIGIIAAGAFIATAIALHGLLKMKTLKSTTKATDKLKKDKKTKSESEIKSSKKQNSNKDKKQK